MDIINRYYSAFNQKNWKDMLACLTDDVSHEINQSETQTGKGLFEAFIEKMDASYDESLYDMVIFYNEDKTRAAAEFRVRGVYKLSDDGLPPAKGQSYDLPVGAFFEIKDGLIARVTNYYNLQTWIKSVS